MGEMETIACLICTVGGAVCLAISGGEGKFYWIAPLLTAFAIGFLNFN